jgi:hypothetical protein
MTRKPTATQSTEALNDPEVFSIFGLHIRPDPDFCETFDDEEYCELFRSVMDEKIADAAIKREYKG